MASSKVALWQVFHWVLEGVWSRQGDEPLQKFTDQQGCAHRLLIRMVEWTAAGADQWA